jgi:hypothetical protein
LKVSAINAENDDIIYPLIVIFTIQSKVLRMGYGACFKMMLPKAEKRYQKIKKKGYYNHKEEEINQVTAFYERRRVCRRILNPVVHDLPGEL